jgi:ATP-binding cassette subfamily B protein
MMALEVAMDLLQPTLIAHLVDAGIERGDRDVLVQTGMWMFVAAIVGLFGGVACTVFAVKATMHFAADVRAALFRKVQQLSFGNLDRLETGQLITRLTNDVTQTQEVVSMLLRIMVRSPLLLIGSLIMAVITSPQLASLFLVLIPVVTLTIIWIFNRSYPRFEVVQRSLDELNTVMQENLAGVRVVRAFSRNAYEQDRFHESNSEFMENNIGAVRSTVIALPAMMIATSFGMVAAIWFGGHRVANGQMQIGDLIAFITYLTQAMIGLMFFSQLVVRVSRGEASAQRIREVLDSQPDLRDPATPTGLGEPEGRLVFDNVSMRYSEGDEPVLKDISFAVEPGETLAILGATGSGKSTLVNLIPRFYDVEQGRITIDGADIRDLPQQRIRELVGIALQESVLFTGTIRDNIRYGRPDASEEEVIAAARAAQADPFIRDLPDGYDSIVGQRGVNLSGGQKQRIAIARALLTSPKLLILDDSTSAVDVGTEARIQAELGRFPQTRVIVAQRISSVVGADKIIILEDGQVIGEGTHEELLASNPAYQEIHESQLQQGITAHVK